MSDEEPAGLDPDAAIRQRGGPVAHEATEVEAAGDLPPRRFEPVIDTRRYQYMIGAFGLTLVVAFSVFLFLRGGSGTPGIVAGQRLPRFVAPLATSDLNASANAHPVCNRRRPARRGLNVCGRRPIVLAFFTLGQTACIRQVDALQAISGEFPRVQFAAVAVGGGHSATAKVVAEHHWTIPVAYDSADVVGQIYGIEVCPLAEIGRRNDRVAALLIGRHWDSADHLAGEITRLKLGPKP